MAKKKLNADVPKKARMKTIADQLWSYAVRDEWNWECAVCGKTGKRPNAHHIIPRQHEATRYLIHNGICLCFWCHQRDPDESPHNNALGWLDWLSEHLPNLHRWYRHTIATNAHKAFSGTTNKTYYCGVIEGFREYVPKHEFERIVGVKFARWLAEQKEEN